MDAGSWAVFVAIVVAFLLGGIFGGRIGWQKGFDRKPWLGKKVSRG